MTEKQYFPYGERELAYLCSRDQRLAEVITSIGKIDREIGENLFSGLTKSIVGQQISTKAQVTIWGRMKDILGAIDPETIGAAPLEVLQGCGMSFRKASYIKNAADQVLEGGLDLKALHDLDDEEVCRELSALKGVGIWTAEMLMIFSMQRMDVVSYGDLAIQRGMRMLYHHRKITPELFAKYKRRYSPYGSVASLYLWAIAGGAIKGMKDYAPKKSRS